jgi:hypothetical protein
MRAYRRCWPDLEGASFADYLRKAPEPLDKATFVREFNAFLALHHVEKLPPKPLHSLFKDIRFFHNHRWAVDAIKRAGAAHDWERLYKLISRLISHLRVINVRAQKDAASPDTPLTVSLARAITEEVGFLCHDLEIRAQLLKAECVLHRFRVKTMNKKYLVFSITKSFTDKVPKLKRHHLDVIIAGALVAGKLCDPDSDVIANIPMARHRATIRV